MEALTMLYCNTMGKKIESIAQLLSNKVEGQHGNFSERE